MHRIDDRDAVSSSEKPALLTLHAKTGNDDPHLQA
jgi:hypothetical protein